MSLKAGQDLLHYRLVEKIGEGGMGVVWRAEDSKLGRPIAIKVLPDLLASDPDRLARFQREAKLLAALNHPNIAAIYGLEQAGETRFLVLELVGGETLGERLQRGPLPVEEALDVCRQITEALAAAHEQGILHRDLKPANVKITGEGKVKVLDFGLAKVVEPAGSDPSLSASPTRTTGGTRAGVILGTASYMSPEQARGKEVDRRTDVWAFGCVLYECLTARQVFHGETVTDILGAILHRDPDWNLLPSSLPASILRLLRRCLQRDPRRRLHDIADARIIFDEAGHEPPAAVAGRRGLRAAVLAAGAVVVAAAGFLAGTLVRTGQPARSEAGGEIRFTVHHVPAVAPAEGEERAAEFDFFEPPLALSPDGTKLVYAISDPDGRRRLYLREMDKLEAQVIRGTENATGPFFSPDGQSIGFSSGSELRVTRLAGGTPRTLARLVNFKGGVFTRDGHILFVPSADAGILRIPVDGGEPEVLTSPDPERGERTHRWPQLLPGGEILVTVGTSTIQTFDEASIAVWSPETGQLRTVLQGGMCGRLLPDGRLLYVREGSLLSVPFDMDRLEVSGVPEVIAEDVTEDPLTGAAAFAVSREGTLAYVRGKHSEPTRLWSVDMSGRWSLLREQADDFVEVDVSPDGRHVAVGMDGANSQIWTYDLERQTMSRLTFEWNNTGSLWTPDGRRVVYTRGRAGTSDLFWIPADGSGEPELLAASGLLKTAESWSPDGKVLAYRQMDPETKGDIWLLDMEDRSVRPFLKTPFSESAATFSPDGRWIAYNSNESGRTEVYVRPYPGPGGKWQISIDGGEVSGWKSDGKSLLFSRDRTMFQVDVTTEPAFAAGRPRALFDWNLDDRDGDLLPDDKGFIAVVWEPVPSPPAEIQVIAHRAGSTTP